MSAARRLLLIGGIALAVWGMCYGLWYAVFAEHQALETIGTSLAASFSAAAERNGETSEATLQNYREAKYVYERQVDVHGHWIGLAMLLIVVGIAWERVALSRQAGLLVAITLLTGAALFPLGVLLEIMDHGRGPQVLAVAGSAMVIASLAAVIWGVARARAPASG